MNLVQTPSVILTMQVISLLSKHTRTHTFTQTFLFKSSVSLFGVNAWEFEEGSNFLTSELADAEMDLKQDKNKKDQQMLTKKTWNFRYFSFLKKNMFYLTLEFHFRLFEMGFCVNILNK